ncbi:pirin family protein [Luteolibacter ambystomatis]|uniref:Pirin family protein n=1 Tax=Luteolibacter ambystomatis TaxID=2824561 RepID=A0A975G5Z1_9BACT|nr:pirin family protein [Luteolibacter ambystomatis]QUE49386.1 pirin family protein [Luteolibacter ambystomatis]
MKTLKHIRRKTETHWVGDGFPVSSIFSYHDSGAEISPFLLMDYAAPHEFQPGPRKRGVGAHPHKGFETVTLAYQGEVSHRDSSGGGGTIGPGDVQWMTAGNGVLHDEFHSEEFTRTGGTFEMIQLWVNLPSKDKSAPAGYQTLLRDQIPNVALPDDAGTLRVIAGSFDGHQGAARTFTPIELWDLRLAAGKNIDLPLPDGYTSMVLVLEGEAAIMGQMLGGGDLAVLSREGSGTRIDTREATRALVLAGQPIDEPIAGYGPFVMNTREEILAAFEQFSNGGMGTLD